MSKESIIIVVSSVVFFIAIISMCDGDFDKRKDHYKNPRNKVSRLKEKSSGETVIYMKKKGGVYTIPCKVNGVSLKFIFDTGASDVSLSMTEAMFMFKNGALKESDFRGTQNYITASGEIVENSKVNLKEVEVGGLILRNIEASVSSEMSAPLLLGQSVIQKLGKIQIDGNKLTILN